MIKFIALLTPATLVALLVLWCTAAGAAECERRQLANDVAGQYVVTCEGTLPMVRTFPARRTTVRTVVGESVVRTYSQRGAASSGVRVGVTTVTHMGVRG